MNYTVKIAKIHIDEVKIICPECKEYMTHPDDADREMFNVLYIPEKVWCDNCKRYFKVSQKAKKLLKQDI